MLNVAIVAGGDSGEYRISMKSGRQVEQSLDYNMYRPFLIEITEKGWIYRAGAKRFRVDKNDFSLTIGKRKIRFDVVFNAIHGTPGENGWLQGYFRLLGIPSTSGNVTASALTFNKSYCKDIVARNGVKTANSVHLYDNDRNPVKKVAAALSFPVFVKPNNGGSSVGMSKVNHPSGLGAALKKAFREDREVLVEELVSGRELTCGVYRSKGKVFALPVTEIISRNEFFDFEAKYNASLAQEIVPAKVPAKVSEECREISIRLYRILDCRGVVRFDYIHTGRSFYFLEVNTVPGMTGESIVPKMVRAAGMTFTGFCSLLISEALREV